MSDLISRSALIDEITKYKEGLQEDLDIAILADDDLVRFAIANQVSVCDFALNRIAYAKTAYDVEKVVQQLEEELYLTDIEKRRCLKENPLQFDEVKGYARGIANAIDIVKKGGV